jgi:iron complex outermembrane recepter protein
MSTTHRNLLRAAILASLAAAPAYAQSDNSGPIGEIIVTAERREAPLQDVPLAVSALSAEQVENLQITEAEDLQRIVPSLHMFNNITSPTNLSLSLRGGLQQDASLVVAESPVGIYVDDIYVGRLNGNNTTLSDIERIEVLRGPQGTLYGRNTGYGAIKFISRTPGDEGWFDTTIGAGDYDQYLFKTSMGGPLSDTVGGSMALQWKHKADQYTNVNEGVETGEEESLAMRGKLRMSLSDATEAVFSVAYSDTEHDSLQLTPGITPGVPANCQALPAGECGPGETTQFTTDDLVFPFGEFATNTAWGELSPGPLRDRPQGETKQSIVGLTVNWNINDNLAFKSITGFVKTEDFFHTDFSGTNIVVGATDVEADQLTQELQFIGSAFNDRLDFLAGAFFLQEEATQEFGWVFFAPLSQSLIQTDVTSVALFGEVGFAITDKLKVTGGLRWTDESKDFQFDFENVAFGFNDQVVLEGDYDEWTPRFGLDYAFNDDILVYAQAARGYKSGGFSAIALASTDPVGAYDPETNWTYEAGMKADWLGQRLRTNLAYFFSSIDDIQQNATDTTSGGFEFPVENSGDAEIQGFEFEITAVPFDGLNIFLSGALMSGEYTSLNPESAAAAATFLYGVEADTPQTPDYTISVGFDYTFDFWGEAIGDVSIGADYYEIDEYITAATNDFKSSGWDIWNAFISADIGKNLELKLTGKNLADDFIITAGSRGLGGFISLPPREVMLSLTYRYGE